MLTYFTLYALIFFFAWAFKRFGSEEKYQKRIVLCCCFLVCSVIAFRHPSMGWDLGYQESWGYLDSFNRINEYSWKEVWELEGFLNYEKGYVLFNKVIGSIYNNQQFFLISCAIVSIAPVFILIYKYSDDPTLSTLIFLGLPAFLMLFSGMRQAIAIGICAMSILLLQNKKRILFVAVVLFASLFHSSALMFLFALPAYYVKMNRTFRVISTALLGVVFVFRESIFQILCRWFGYEDVTMDNNGAITLFIVFVAVYIYCYLFDNDAENQGLLNIFYIACFCQAMGGLYSTIIRVGYYFMMALIVLLPQVIKNTQDRTVRVFSKLIVPICFIAFALHSFYTSSWAETYPHYWFWQNV